MLANKVLKCSLWSLNLKGPSVPFSALGKNGNSIHIPNEKMHRLDPE